MSDLVLDASIAVRWILPDEADAEATALRNRLIEGADRAFVPPHMRVEVARVLLREVGRRLTREQAIDGLDLLSETPLELVDGPWLYTRSVQDAERFGIGPAQFDDVVYLALAGTLGLPLWTGDLRFYRALRPLPDWVILRPSTRSSSP